MKRRPQKRPAATPGSSPSGRKNAAQRRKDEAPRGRLRKKAEGPRLNRTQLAVKLGRDRGTVSGYLAQPGAPKPDRLQRYDVREVRDWIEANAPRISGNAEELKALNLSIKKMEAEDMELDLRERRGELVAKKAIEPTIVAFLNQLTEDLRSKFEFELPAKLAGKTPAEVAKMNGEAIDFVLQRLKAGAAPLTNTPAAAPPS